MHKAQYEVYSLKKGKIVSWSEDHEVDDKKYESYYSTMHSICDNILKSPEELTAKWENVTCEKCSKKRNKK